ncbi:MAG: phosphopantothenoylcysteine decarboxylase [Bacteroidetes bacterium]|jgi:phosphopantothenoylcysteine decarboxylase/phosphopantothenate--cysteine ligase|nr:phosphopantothenoylcysteine decarboxylase [Bacteroidota bacterium]
MPTPDAVRTEALSGRKILLGVTGGIAAYKSALLVRLLKRSGAEVQVLMTPDAERFISALTLGTLSEREVLTDIFPENAEGSWTKHITLGLWADLFVVAPATAQTIAKLAHGFSDTMLTVTALAARCPLLVCPAMDHDMYIHPAVQDNLERLRGLGYAVLEADSGELASGLVGQGRMPEPEVILQRVVQAIERREAAPPAASGDSAAEEVVPAPPPADPSLLAGKTVLVTAGPTHEPIDPVRVFTNRSTGTMGFALAAAAQALGGDVTLVAGPTALPTPAGVTRVDVETAAEMHAAVDARADADLVLMAAAVADYTPATVAEGKLKKDEAGLTLHFERTVDILAALGQQKRPGQQLIGFALETDNGVAHAREKLTRKNLDWIALNRANEAGAGFGPGTNRITLLGADGSRTELATQPKPAIARALLLHVCTAGTPAA